MSNVIDDVILSAQKTPDGVVIQLTIDMFRQLISALNYNDGAWVATDNPADSPADSSPQSDKKTDVPPADADSQTDQQTDVPADESSPKQDHKPDVQAAEPDRQIVQQSDVSEDDSGDTVRRRSPNQKITIKDAKTLFDMARKHPHFTKPQLLREAGLLPYTIYNSNHRFDIFGDGVLRTLNELIKLGRIIGTDTINRFAGDVFDESAVAEMGISSKYRREE